MRRISWKRTGYDIYLYHVLLENTSDHAVQFNLRRFTIVAVGGSSYGPVNVRRRAKTPPAFLPESMSLPPGASVDGWLTFDGRINFVPRRAQLPGRQADAEHRVQREAQGLPAILTHVSSCRPGTLMGQNPPRVERSADREERELASDRVHRRCTRPSVRGVALPELAE